MKHLTKIACGLAAAALTFTLVACDDSSSASNTTGLDKDKVSFENDDVENTDSDENLDIDEKSDSDEDLDSDEDSDADEDFDTEESSDSVESSDSNESSSSEDDSSASLDDNSSSSMAVTCQALTLECYSAQQLCNRGMTEYCGSSSSNNSSSSAVETCQHVSDVDGGTCQDYDVVKDCATGAYAVCRNNRWTPAIIGDNCRPIGDEISVNDIKLTCNEDSYWEYIPVYNNCPPGNYSCQPPNYDCLTHPINGFSCNEGNNKVYQLTVTTRASGECLYQCSGGKYSVVMPPTPVGN